jgi:putative transposase
MLDINSFLLILNICLDATTLGRLRIIVLALLSMSGRVTMLGISRWAEEGGRYRTIQRFFNTPIDWDKINWFLVRHYFLKEEDNPIIIAGDETVVTKSGKNTYGLNRFFSSLYGKTVPGLSYFAFSLVNTKMRTSFPLMIRQIIRSKEENKGKNPQFAEKKNEESNKKRKRGRPKGSTNQNKENVVLSPYLLHIQNMLKKIKQTVGTDICLIYAVFDGAFGHNAALQMVKQCDMHMISKLQSNSALYFPYAGTYCGKGRKRKYGDKIDFVNIPKKYLKKTSKEKFIETNIYQMTMLHKLFAQKLNIVIITKTNLKNNTISHVILFSSDLDLDYEKLIDYYSLRFKIEFNFRDAKQYWGLEDFMNTKEIPVTNSANLAFFMVNLSQLLIYDARQHNPLFSVQDLKAYFRGRKYVKETLKLLPQKPDPILIRKILSQIAKIGSINRI